MIISEFTGVGREGLQRFSRVNFITDPIWGQIEFTKSGEWGVGEDSLLVSPWLQRLRRIHQLQSAWRVFPTAEHSRFTHVLGTMHVAGKYALHLYESLLATVEGTPSRALVEETLRLAGLLHDVGHGPFGHFFDQKYAIPRYGVDHEIVGRKLILGELSSVIRDLRVSPTGSFEAGEEVDPMWVAWLIDPREIEGYTPPAWVAACKPVMCGPATADNFDYVPRDAYMCGVQAGGGDINRLLGYSFIANGTVVLNARARASLEKFLADRRYLYMNIYYHRTTRRVDLAMAEIFAETIENIMPGNPLDHLDEYLELTDWALYDAVRRWKHEPVGSAKRRLGEAWDELLGRQLRWQVAYETQANLEVGKECLEARIRAELSDEFKDGVFQVDIASANLAPSNPMSSDGSVVLYNDQAGAFESVTTAELISHLPAFHQMVRVMCDGERLRQPLRIAAEKVLGTTTA